MRILRGSLALSEFRVNKLLIACPEQQLPVTGIYAEFMHFADLKAELNPQELEKLENCSLMVQPFKSMNRKVY